MGAASRARRPERDGDPNEAERQAEGGEPRPAVSRSKKAAEQKDENGLGAHHERHIRARGQRCRLAEQQEGDHLPDQSERKEFGP